MIYTEYEAEELWLEEQYEWPRVREWLRKFYEAFVAWDAQLGEIGDAIYDALSDNGALEEAQVRELRRNSNES